MISATQHKWKKKIKKKKKRERKFCMRYKFWSQCTVIRTRAMLLLGGYQTHYTQPWSIIWPERFISTHFSLAFSWALRCMGTSAATTACRMCVAVRLVELPVDVLHNTTSISSLSPLSLSSFLVFTWIHHWLSWTHVCARNGRKNCRTYKCRSYFFLLSY